MHDERCCFCFVAFSQLEIFAWTIFKLKQNVYSFRKFKSSRFAWLNSSGLSLFKQFSYRKLHSHFIYTKKKSFVVNFNRLISFHVHLICVYFDFDIYFPRKTLSICWHSQSSANYCMQSMQSQKLCSAPTITISTFNLIEYTCFFFVVGSEIGNTTKRFECLFYK